MIIKFPVERKQKNTEKIIGMEKDDLVMEVINIFLGDGKIQLKNYKKL